MKKLFQYLYTSDLSLHETPACVADIVRVSKIKNNQMNITGLLVFDGEHFCQYLEGSKSLVKGLIETIRIDHRHTNFLMRHEGTFDGPRRYSAWSIAYATVDEASLEKHFIDADGPCAVERLENLMPQLDIQPN